MDARFTAVLVGTLAIAVVIGLIAAGSRPKLSAPPTTSTPSGTPIPLPLVHHIDILDSSTGSTGFYYPSPLRVRVGQTVTWDNMASGNHTVTANDGTFDSGVLAPGQSFHWKPTKEGVYTYSCFIHPDMHGEIIVQP